jgi:hypothetical protein
MSLFSSPRQCEQIQTVSIIGSQNSISLNIRDIQTQLGFGLGASSDAWTTANPAVTSYKSAYRSVREDPYNFWNSTK